MRPNTQSLRLAIGISLACLALAAAAQPAPPRLLSLGAEGGDLRASLSDGSVLHGRDLVGATLVFTAQDGLPLSVRIDAAIPDPRPEAREVWLFDLKILQPGGETPFCDADPEGRRAAIPYPAPGTPQGYAWTCTAGAAGKCLRFGYRVWAFGPDGASLAPLHATCVKLLRGDYGGDGHGWTRNGMKIDLWDEQGIQTPETADPMPFEAGWDENGAVCLAHPRVPENGSLDDIARAHPRLAGRTGPEACTEEKAKALGAVLFNRSMAN